MRPRHASRRRPRRIGISSASRPDEPLTTRRPSGSGGRCRSLHDHGMIAFLPS
jgi:hypothetical protein